MAEKTKTENAETAEQKTTALAQTSFKALSLQPDELKMIVQDNLSGMTLSASDLTKIKVPGSGGLLWRISTLDGGDEDVKAIRGIILAHQQIRAYWDTNTPVAGEMPKCYSIDCSNGIGIPGGHCASCAFSQFGSKNDGQGAGQACKQVRWVFFLRQGDVLPTVLQVPPSSDKAFKPYLTKLTNALVPLQGVVTEFTLAREKNKQGIEYSRIVFDVARDSENKIIRVSDVEMQRAKQYAQFFAPLLQQVAEKLHEADPTDVTPTGDSFETGTV